MTSRLRLTTEQRWAVIRDAWERGDFDRMRRLLSHAEAGLPEGAANWLAEVLSGEAKRPRGRRPVDPGKQLATDFGREMEIRQEYRIRLLAYQWLADDDAMRGDTPKDRVLATLADRYGLTVDAVSHMVHPRRKVKARKSGN